jgi:anti-sigma B factor antagonist
MSSDQMGPPAAGLEPTLFQLVEQTAPGRRNGPPNTAERHRWLENTRLIMAGVLNGSGIAAPADKGGFAVEESWFASVIVLSVSGALDLLTAPHMVDAIGAAVNQAPTGVIVDLSKVEFLASTGMNVLVSAHRQITPATGFGVVADGPVTGRPLKLLGLDRLLSVFPTLDDALQSFTET